MCRFHASVTDSMDKHKVRQFPIKPYLTWRLQLCLRLLLRVLLSTPYTSMYCGGLVAVCYPVGPSQRQRAVWFEGWRRRSVLAAVYRQARSTPHQSIPTILYTHPNNRNGHSNWEWLWFVNCTSSLLSSPTSQCILQKVWLIFNNTHFLSLIKWL